MRLSSPFNLAGTPCEKKAQLCRSRRIAPGPFRIHNHPLGERSRGVRAAQRALLHSETDSGSLTPDCVLLTAACLLKRERNDPETRVSRALHLSFTL